MRKTLFMYIGFNTTWKMCYCVCTSAAVLYSEVIIFKEVPGDALSEFRVETGSCVISPFVWLSPFQSFFFPVLHCVLLVARFEI